MAKCQRCGKDKDDGASYCPEWQTSIRNRLIGGAAVILIFILILIAILK
ncbi:MAG: hypothetical protein DDT40_01972 [candidate division WS2 bacterium]|nr:hypothetical protein [Candidatus Psychracetigena formicireducens]